MSAHLSLFSLLRQSGEHSMQVRMLDAAVVCLGEPTGYPVPMNAPPKLSDGVSSLLWDNLWGTNYIMWVPFANASSTVPVPNDPDLLFRYSLKFT